MSEFTSAMRMVNGGRFSAAIQRVDYPIHKRCPEPQARHVFLRRVRASRVHGRWPLAVLCDGVGRCTSGICGWLRPRAR